MTDIRLYGKIVSLKNRLELNAEQGRDFTNKQIADAVLLIDQINEVLDRRKDSRRKS